MWPDRVLGGPRMSEYEPDSESGGGMNNPGADAVRISDAELITNLQQVADELGKVPASREMDDHGEYSRGPYRSHFGRWNKALEAAGLKESTDDEEHECPWEGCDYTSNEDGVRRHHKLAHGESIAGVEVVCENCGKVYSEKPHRARSDGRNFHNRACFDEYMAENQLANTQKRPWHDEETVREFYVERDMSARELGDMLGCSTQAILRSLSRFGIEKDLSTWEQTPEELKDKETLRELYVERDVPARKVADELGCAISTVLRWARKHGLEPYSRTIEKLRDEKLLRRLYVEEKLTTQEVADRLGCGKTTVRTWLDRHGIETRPRKPPATDELTDATTLRRLYVEQEKSASEVADELGCHKPSVLYWLRKHGIERRRRQDPAVPELEDAELMEWLYVGQRKTQREIAAELGCKRSHENPATKPLA
jgi:transposase-like protein